MNHLHELIESKVTPANGLENNSRAFDIYKESSKYSSMSVSFSMGDLMEFGNLRVIPELIKYPFNICWFEGYACAVKGESPVILGVLASEDPAQILIYRRARGTWILEGYLSAVESKRNPEIASGSAESSKYFCDFAISCVGKFLSALHCSNVRRQEHAPPAKLQKARQKRGKIPLFSYWTLELDGNNERGERQGGTHASPRVHLRRGHPREYAPGLWTWVQPCAVGNRRAGMVHKDYSAGPALVAAAR